MLNQFLQHTRKPKGTLGRMMLKGMNAGHSQLSAWGLGHLYIKQSAHILDVGCGGGANIAAMLETHPNYRQRAIGIVQQTKNGTQ